MAQILDMPSCPPRWKKASSQKWTKKEGDKVSPGDLIAEVETDKAIMDFESWTRACCSSSWSRKATSVKLGAPVAIIGKAGEDITQAGRGGEGARQRQRRQAGGASAGARQAGAPRRRRPRPRRAAAANGQAAAARGRAAPAPPPKRARRARRRGRTAPARSAGGKVLASPLARRLATDLGIDLRGVTGHRPGRPHRRARREGRRRRRRRRRAATDWHAAEEAPQTSAPRVSAAAPLPAQIVPERRSEARPAPGRPGRGHRSSRCR